MLLRLLRKSHALAHIVHDLEVTDVPVINPWKGCNWMEEDFIGDCMTVVNSVCSRSVTCRAIEFMDVHLGMLVSRRGL